METLLGDGAVVVVLAEDGDLKAQEMFPFVLGGVGVEFVKIGFHVFEVDFPG